MSDLPNPNEATIDQVPPPADNDIRQQFMAAWEKALRGGPLPDPDGFLAPLPETERRRLRPELERLEQQYLQRRGTSLAADETLPLTPEEDGGPQDVAPPTHRIDPPTAILEVGAGPTGTLDYRPPAPETTPDQRPADPGATVDQRPADPSATVDQRPRDPTGTLDYRPPEPGGTIDPRPADSGGTVAYGSTERTGSRAADRTRAPRGRETVPQETVAGYEILGVLGRGAMGVVYKARQRGLKRVVALKMILAGGHASEHELARFRVEAEAVGQLQHPNLVQIYEVGDEDGLPFFSLEYVDGGSLSRKIGGTPQPPAAAAAMVHQLAQGMECAHQNGVIHRDLKPANILLTHDGVPKITDFGLAKRLEDEAGQTHSGTILGTPSYMAPEQAEGKIHEIGPLADVYALGAILYEMLTGRAPFKAASVLDTLHQVRTQEPVAPTQLQPKVPRDLETICLKCLQKDPAKRYETAGALAEDLRRFLGGEPIKARPVGRVERLWRWCRRNPKVAALLAGVGVALVLWAGTATFLGVQLALEKDETERQKLQAQANEGKALREADRANKNKEVADHNAEKARKGGEVALQSLVDLGQEVQARLHSRRLVRQVGPEVRAMRDDILDLLRRNMLGLTEKLEKTEITPFGRIAAYVSLGDLLQKLSQGEEASGQFQQAYERAAEIVAAQPESDKARGNLATVLLRLGDIALDLNGDARSARGYFEQAHQLQKVILEQPRDPKRNALETKISLSHTDARLARACLALGRPAEARAHLEEALAYRKAWVLVDGKASARPHSYVAEAQMWLGIASAHLGDRKAAAGHFGEALHICEQLARFFPNDPGFVNDQAEVVGHLGDAQLRLGQVQAARQSYERSQKHLQVVLNVLPDDLSLLPLQARTNDRLGAVALAEHKGKEAEGFFQEALKLHEDMLGVEPRNLNWRADYLLALAHGGRCAEAVSGANDLLRRAPASTPVLLQLARCYAVCAAAAADPAEKQRDTTRALEVLQAATAGDYQDVFALQTDPDLASLRETSAYRELLARLTQKR